MSWASISAKVALGQYAPSYSYASFVLSNHIIREMCFADSSFFPTKLEYICSSLSAFLRF